MIIGLFPDFYQAMGEDGPYTARAYRVEAVTPEGEVYLHFESFNSEEEAASLVDRIERHIETHPKWSPFDNENWFFHRRVYGGQAFQANRTDEEHQMQKLDVEAESGPGSYQPRHPGYLRNAV